MTSQLGRGRGRIPKNAVYKDSSSFPMPTTSGDFSLPSLSSSKYDLQSESGYSSTSTSSQPSPPTGPAVPTARGRGDRFKRNVAPADPHWTVSDLTAAQFKSNKRPVKPDEL
ncbi:unnamed protein product, partial [Rotaria magnacalcarata]